MKYRTFDVQDDGKWYLSGLVYEQGGVVKYLVPAGRTPLHDLSATRIEDVTERDVARYSAHVRMSEIHEAPDVKILTECDGLPLERPEPDIDELFALMKAPALA